jgi:hypothetical protein
MLRFFCPEEVIVAERHEGGKHHTQAGNTKQKINAVTICEERGECTGTVHQHATRHEYVDAGYDD